MGLTPRYSGGDVRKLLLQKQERIYKAIIHMLAYLGELSVNHARTAGDYTDQTGNLRSSIGYVVIANGKRVKQNFLSVGGPDGVRKAKALVDELQERFPTGFALIVVAGMNYAFYVETKGRNVLSSAEHYAQSKLPEMMKQLKLAA